MTEWNTSIDDIPTDKTPLFVLLEDVSLGLRVHAARCWRSEGGGIMLFIGHKFHFDTPPVVAWVRQEDVLPPLMEKSDV